MSEAYTCAICGYTSGIRADFMEFKDPIKLPKVIERARSRGSTVQPEDVRFVCLRCNLELYQEETKPPRPVRIVCPRCGEVIEVWF